MHGPDAPAGWRNLARREEGFNDLLYAQLKKTPWWLISAATHGVLVVALFAMSFGPAADLRRTEMVARVAEPIEDMLLPDQKPEIETPPPVDPVERKIEDATVDDSQVTEQSEDPVEIPSEKPFSNTTVGDLPLEGFGDNPTIGIGGNWGGGGGGVDGRRTMRARGDGSTKRAVNQGLEWLHRHQSRDGMWDSDGFMSQCKLSQCDGPGHPLYDPGVSGLALLAFLGAGETHRHGEYRDTVAKGLKYLKQIQDPEGCGPRTTGNFTYNHAIGALAMTEAYALTGSPLFKQSAQQAIDFVHKSQNPYLAWRYGVRPGDNDTSVTGWMVMALKSAKLAELRVDDAAFQGTLTWIDKVTEPEYGRVGYNGRGTGPARPTDRMDEFPADRSESMTAVGILTRIFCGEDPRESKIILKGADLCLKALPVWDEESGVIDMYYWYYGTLAMFQVGGDAFKAWNESLRTAVIDHQRQDGDEAGSWDPVGPWGRDGGRVYSTALLTMCMEVYYRYDRVFGAGRGRR